MLVHEASVLELVAYWGSYLDFAVACWAAGVEARAFCVCGGPVGKVWLWWGVWVVVRVWVFVYDGGARG